MSQIYIKSTHTQNPSVFSPDWNSSLEHSCHTPKKHLSFRQNFIHFLMPAWLFLVSVLYAQAQSLHSEDGKSHFGINIGGVSKTTFPNQNPIWNFKSPSTRTNIGGGVFFEYDIRPELFLHVEVNTAGSRLIASASSADTATGDFEIDYKFTNISTPLGLGYRFFPSTSNFNVAILAAAVIGLPQHNESNILIKNHKIEKNINLINIGGMLEVRFNYHFMHLSFRYEITGTPVFRYEDFSLRTGTFSFLLGFHIF